MATSFTTDQLIAQIKRRGMVPTSQNTFRNTDFLELADEEMQTGIVPLLLAVRQEFFVTNQDIALQTGVDHIEIPERAIGRNIRDIVYSQSSPITSQSQLYSLARLEPDLLPWQQNVNRSTNDYMFYMKDDYFVLVPTPRGVSGTLRVLYHRRPNDLVETRYTSQIVSIDTTTQVTVNQIPTNITDSVDVDIISATAGFRSKGDDLDIASIDTVANTITFTADLPTDLAVGDYISERCTSPIPQIPRELQPLLAQRVAVKCLEALGDRQGMQVAQAKADQIEQAVKVLITPRVRGEERKIVAPNYYEDSYWNI
jgi:hypothetical protein